MESSIRATVLKPEFDRLRNIEEIHLNQTFLDFLQKAEASLESRRTLKKRDTLKRSLLHYAAMGNCDRLLQLLLQHEPDIDSRDMYGRTPLHWAAEYGSLAVVKALLDRGANINALDFENATPLSNLVYAGNPSIGNMPATEAFLRKRGAKMNGNRGAVQKALVWFLTYSRLLPYVRPNV